MARWFDKIMKQSNKKSTSLLRSIVTGSFYRVSDLRTNTDFDDICTQINTMRALAQDSQIGIALSYYATDATTPNSSGDIIWAVPIDKAHSEVADIINTLFKKWNVKNYARDHILELATIGNLYIPTSSLYREPGDPTKTRNLVSLDGNTIPDESFEILPSYSIPPETIIHLWHHGQPQGFMIQPDEDSRDGFIRYDESAVVHFSLGGLLGNYQIDAVNQDNDILSYDIQFAQPLMEKATQPTQTLSLLEDAMLLSSLSRIVKFVNIECGNAEDTEIQDSLQQIKDAIEQQLSLNTATGDAQSFVNPQSPNNLIYLPRVNGSDAVSITDLNMADATEADNKLLDYYQNKKLSVLGVPKEAMNFSSSEGLGGAGSVMSQRSALYANALSRLENAYINGWTDAINKYFISKGMSGNIGQFELHMNPILTEMSVLNFDKRDSALNQATTLVTLLKDIGVDDKKSYREALIEVLSEVLPKTGNDINKWSIDLDAVNGEGGSGNEF